MRPPCDLCGGQRLREYATSIYHHRGREYDLVRCASCGLVQVRPLPSEEDVASLYGDDYFEKDYDSCLSEKDYFHNLDQLKERYEDILDHLERFRSVGDLLEVGCAGGYFLDLARRRGWKVRGVEITEIGTRHAREEFGLDVHHGSFPGAPWGDESFDVIYMGHILEHVRYPSRGMGEAVRLLRTGGVLLAEVPTYVDSPYFQVLRRAIPLLRGAGLSAGPILRTLKFPRPGEVIPPFHLYEFRRATLVRLFRRFGLDVLRVVSRVPKPDSLNRPQGLVAHVLGGLFQLLDFAALRVGFPGGNIALYGRKAG